MKACKNPREGIPLRAVDAVRALYTHGGGKLVAGDLVRIVAAKHVEFNIPIVARDQAIAAVVPLKSAAHKTQDMINNSNALV